MENMRNNIERLSPRSSLSSPISTLHQQNLLVSSTSPTNTLLSIQSQKISPTYCSFCHQKQSDELFTLCGPLIGPFEIKNNCLYFHLYCLYYSWDVWIDSMTDINQDLHQRFFIFPKLPALTISPLLHQEEVLLINNLKNVVTNYQRTFYNKCTLCQKIRATVACSISKCSSQYHFPCAKRCVKYFYCSMAFILVIFHALPVYCIAF